MNNLSMIAAIGSNYELGKDNQLLWHISNDLKWFKKLTSGHPVIMGRKTFESLNYKPLPNRKNFVLTNDMQFKYAGVEVEHNIEEVLKRLDPKTEAFVVGGEAIYKLFLPYAHRMYLTMIDRTYEADVFFPRFNMKDWKIIERVDISDDIQAGVNYSFVTFERTSNNY